MVMIMMAIMILMIMTTRLLMSPAGYKRVERRQLTADGIAFPLRLTSPLLLGWSIARIVMMWWSSYDGNGDDHHQHQIGDHHHPKYIVMVDVREHLRWLQWSLNDKCHDVDLESEASIELKSQAPHCYVRKRFAKNLSSEDLKHRNKGVDQWLTEHFVLLCGCIQCIQWIQCM